MGGNVDQTFCHLVKSLVVSSITCLPLGRQEEVIFLLFKCDSVDR